MGALPIPDVVLDEDIALVGRKGGGKTFTAKGIVERLLDLGRRVLVLDPLGVWPGLRTGADGSSPGYPIAIFGGRHADLPLDPAAAVPLAKVIAAENLPAVIDLSDLTKHAQQTFLLAFLHELRRVNENALTIVLEEADVFAPQQPLGDDSKALHAEIDWIARRGRFKGFRLITITQRPARLSKDVLTQCSTLIAHKLPAPQDRDAVKAWVEGNGDRDKAREVFDTLAGLDVGEAWIWSPQNGVLKRDRFPRIKTLDTSATPKAGETRIEPKTLATVDLSGIRNALAKAKAEQEKPERKPVGAKSATTAAELKEAEERGYHRGLEDGGDRTLRAVSSLASDLAAALARAESAAADARRLLSSFAGFTGALADDVQQSRAVARPAPQPIPKSVPKRQPAEVGGDVTLGSAARKILAVLDTNPPVRRTWTQVAMLAGLKAHGGAYNVARKQLRDGGHVREDGALVQISAPSDGATAPVLDPAGMVDQWAAVVSTAAARIMRLLAANPDGMPKAEIATSLDVKPHGGSWNVAWKELRDNDIVELSGDVARLTELFRP